MNLRHLHLGVAPENLSYVTYYFKTKPFVEAWFSEDDGWNSWGELIGEDTNDASTHHFIVEFDAQNTALFFDHANHLLKANVLERAKDGCVWAITDKDTWSVVHFALHQQTGDAAPGNTHEESK